MTADLRVGLIPGDGVVMRLAEKVVVVGRADDVEPDVVDRLAEAVAAASGDRLVRRLARLLLTDDDPPPLAVATIGDDVVSVFLHGDIELIWPEGRASGADHVLGVTETISLTAGFTIATGQDGDPDVETWSDLGAGTVPGGGVLVAARDAAPEEAAELLTPPDDEAPMTEETPVIDAGSPPPVPVAAGDAELAAGSDAGDAVGAAEEEEAEEDNGADEPFEAISLTDAVDLSDRAPLPVALAEPDDEDERPPYERTVHVIGVFSPRGFFNHPDAKYCSRTGVKMGASRTMVLTEGPRPPLGVLTLDDGSTLTVRWTTVIGRDPTVDELVRTGEAAPFIVSDLAQSVSRRHALLELVDWDVFITDLGSRNHTYIQSGPDQPLRQLGVGERVALHSGTIVHLGKRSFVYNEHHVR